MPFYQCPRCMKKYIDHRAILPACPFCHCRVLTLTGPAPTNPSRAVLLHAPAGSPIVQMTRPAVSSSLSLSLSSSSSTSAPPLSIPLPSPVLPSSAPAGLVYEFLPLSSGHVVFWRNYAGAMRMIANNGTFDRTMKDGWSQAILGFMHALEVFEESPTSEVWIAVATHAPVDYKNFAATALNIEMCMTVTTHVDVPITTHMGIFRSPLRDSSKLNLDAVRDVGRYETNSVVALLAQRDVFPMANGISKKLHAFAAHSCLSACRKPEKRFMITAPLYKMLEILKHDCAGFATAKIRLLKSADSATLMVAKDSIVLGKNPFEKYKWLDKLADLDGNRLKIAINIIKLAQLHK